VKAPYQVASPPPKPLMVFDGDCNFCGIWVRRWRETTGDAVEYLPFQDASIAERFPEIPRERFASAVHLIEIDGAVYYGAEAAFRALGHNAQRRWLLAWYGRSELFARTAERAYKMVARHRTFFSVLTRGLWGQHAERSQYHLVRWLFLRALALVYLIAFISLWTQILGLVGADGILPAKATMDHAREEVLATHIGLDRFHVFPTLCWFSASDRSLQWQCALGTVLSVLLLIGIAPAPCLFLLWLIYLSLSTICRDFLGFQWDILLLETGFLAIFFAPPTLLPRCYGLGQPALRLPYCHEASLYCGSEPPRVILWLLRGLLFCLMFESGCVKLLSGDPTWHNLTALSYHYETQPLPTWIGWYAYQLPAGFQKTSTALMFGIELIVPFLIFTPRRLRFFACATLIGLQLFILLTGNYCFFNVLTIVLCLLLLDDAFLDRIVPRKLRPCLTPPTCVAGPVRNSMAARIRRLIHVTLACVFIAISLLQFSSLFRWSVPWPKPMLLGYQWLSPFRTFSSYGLFAVMTTSRPEIIVEGSNDGVTWFEYELKYKPGDVKRRPRFVAPHQPRLDWQMWFAALGDYRQNPWFINFSVRLLQGSPDVLHLLQRNPFPKAPPRYIRALVYEYHFTDMATRRKTGAWWRREQKGEYLPVISLSE
jgi:lipase maturation factor 1